MGGKIKAILWDVHGVLYRGSFTPVYRAFSMRLGIPEDSAGKIIEENFPAMLVGSFTMRDFDAILHEKFGKVKDTKKLFIESMKEHITMYPELLALVDALRLSVKQVVFSNMGDMRDLFDQQTGIYNHFDDLMLSFKLGLAKPSPKFFILACTRLGLSADEMILVDDSETNIIAAQAFGMKGIVYKNLPQLREELSNFGFIL